MDTDRAQNGNKIFKNCKSWHCYNMQKGAVLLASVLIADLNYFGQILYFPRNNFPSAVASN